MAVPEAEEVARRAVDRSDQTLPGVLERLAAFSDPNRLRLLIAIHAAPGSSVGALADATGMTANAVTQSLARLREHGLVERRRDGRLSRWTLSDAAAHELLHHLGAPHSALHPPH